MTFPAHASWRGSVPSRLNRNDNIFVVMDQALGTPVTVLYLWDIDFLFDAKHFADFGDQLKRGRMSRKLVRTHLGRDYWVQDESAGQVIVRNTSPEGSATLNAWAQELLAENPLDLVGGQSWFFAAAPDADGKTWAVLASSHAIADGSAKMLALKEALAGEAFPVPDAGEVSVLENLRDHAVLLREVGAAGVQLLKRTLKPGKTASAEEASGNTDSVDTLRPVSGDRSVASTAFVIPMNEFIARAQEASGTANSLFVAIVGRVAQRLGTLPESSGPHAVAVPMSKRVDPADVQANLSQGATMRARFDESVYQDLTGVRRGLKTAYGQLSDELSAVDLTFEIAQCFPDWLLGKLAGGSTPPPALASNLGAIAPEVTSLGLQDAATGEPASGRLAVYTSGSFDNPLMNEGELGATNAWATVTGDEITMCIMAPEQVGGSAVSVAQAVAEELEAWGLPARRWF